uniref:WLGC domain-containing protein n=1 Tax=Globisporangium ultimum (strain ATCC 200006 / CBS 805.95 / DAOM BR144) TaxID=431595 RepID=K3WCB0_GLOUD
MRIKKHVNECTATTSPTVVVASKKSAIWKSTAWKSAIWKSAIWKSAIWKRETPTRILASLFFITGAVIHIYSIVAVHSSKSLCAAYPKCAVVSYQWNINYDDCTCLVFVDRDLAPTTFSKWLDPPDTTANLARLAAAGELRIIQIINRALTELPIELCRCHHLEQLILLYTKLPVVPDWANQLHKLEYLHIEGDFTPRQLTYLPPDLFIDMPRLAFLHLGCISKVPEIPALSKLHHLRYLAIAVAHSVTEYPSFEGLDSLMTLHLIDGLHVDTLPTFTPLKELTEMTMTSRNSACCNGYVTGVCDLSDFQCLPRADEPVVTCTSARMSEADHTFLSSIDTVLCERNVTLDIKSYAATLYSTDTLCGGVKYKACTLGSASGICYNARMQVISCIPNPNFIAMREALIAQNAGDPCDPDVEAWLGCTA